MISKDNCGKPCGNMDERLLKRARKKFLSAALAAELVKLDSPLNKAYAITHGCSATLAVSDIGELRALFYCRRRWCQTCASINMATLIEKYTPELKALQDPHFVTLTVRNCRADKLPAVLEEMGKTWRRITDKARKKGIPLRGIRKTEIKSSIRKHFHPHFHLIVEGADAAEWLRTEWLLRLNYCTSPDGQDVRKIDKIESAIIEVLKYATKLTCADDCRNQPLCTPWEMDVIFRTTHGKRLIQPFGGVRAIPEDAFEITPDVVHRAAGIYEWIGHDWFHTEYGHALSNWKPEPDEVRIYRKLTR